ncbi:MAG: lytic transglycosylase domain-containing protein [Oscillospiraceae bacterium]|nr:lytic transglycosylase domain-containing protein [Oscillospiraceae bacterium]
MGKIIRNALLGLLIVAFLIFAGVMMNRSTKLLEHWAYPIEFSDIVEQKSKEYDVPISVIYAVIRTESGFDSEAESWVGARGLMQITKDAHDWIDYYRGESKGSWDEMYVPEINIDYGVWLLSYLYTQFGNWETAYAAYNAGPNAVKKWLENPEYSEDGITLYYIPYEETSNYQKKVSAYRAGYISAYGFD